MDGKKEENGLTPFEVQLSQYFPEIFELHILGKAMESGGGGESHIWDLVGELLEMHRTASTGIIFINYNKGKIDNISIKKDVLAFKKNRPGY